MELVNRTLYCVWQTLDEVLERRNDICKCDKCRHDMACMAMNNLKPNYFVSKHGAVYAKLNELSQQKNIDILAEVARAVDKVSRNPHHLD